MRGISEENLRAKLERRGGRPLSAIVREIFEAAPSMEMLDRIAVANQQRQGPGGRQYTSDYKRQVNSESYLRRKKMAEEAGLSVGSLLTAGSIVRAADSNPERYGFLIDVLDNDSIAAALRELRRTKAASRGERAPETIVQNATSMMHEVTQALKSVDPKTLDPVTGPDLRGELTRAAKRLREEIKNQWQTK